MRSALLVEVLVITLVLTAGVPALLAAFPEARAPAVAALVHAPLSEIRSVDPAIEVVEAYESFVLVRASQDRLAAIEARGIPVESQESAYRIGLASVSFDVRDGDPALPADLRAEPTQGPALYIVHFIGPIKAMWLRQLQRMGVEVLHSLPTYAFLVSMDGAARDAVAAERFVDFVGPYHPAYKVRPDLAGPAGPVAVQILTVAPSDTYDVVSALDSDGLQRVRWNAPDTGILSVFRVGDIGVVRARLDASLLTSLARIPRVLWVEPWVEMRIDDSTAQALLQTGLAPGDANARRIWANGVLGAGQVVSLADTGMDFDSNFFRQSAAVIQTGQPGDNTGTLGPLSVYNTTDPTRRKLIRYIPMSAFRGIDPWTGGDPEAVKDAISGGATSGHGTSTSSLAGGSDAGIGSSPEDGMAPNAKLIMQDVGSAGDSLSYIPDSYDDLFGPAYENGSRIHSNSWGAADNGYDLQAMMVDRFVWNHPDMSIFFAAGNAGSALFTVGSPGTAKSAITIGGANPYPGEQNVNGQSSRGPTADGRLKPDIMTFFTGIAAASSGNPIDNSNPGGTQGFGGTSHSTPLAAGMAALAREYFQEGYYPSGTQVLPNGFSPSAALVKAFLTASSRKMTGSGANPPSENRYPNDAQGWGRLALDDAMYLNPATEGQRKLWVVDQTSGLSTGQSSEYRIRVASSTTPLRIVMAYSDYPALPNANPALVNNLNLQVTAPNGSVYKGNVFAPFSLGESLPNSGSFDNRNPIEGVIVNAPGVDEWAVRIEAANVPSGPQGYAIVAAGDLDLGFGDIRLDKKVYSESDTVRIDVHDANGLAPMTVTVKSTVETAGETVAMTETAAGSGVWRGSIATAFGDPAADGTLQVNEGGTIEATYSDSTPAHDAIATAIVDASPPAISNVRAEDITNSAATIKWTTNEPANSKVYYGTNPALLTRTAADTGLVTTHALPLVGLATDTLYYYDVESADALAHTTRDANGGAHYTFRTTAQGDILLVFGDGSFPPDRVAMYRDALTRSAWPFNEWSVAVSGDPPLAVLQQYKVVIWQTGLEAYPAPSDAQRALLTSYLDGGGRLMISGHDIAWSLCAAGTSQYYTPARCAWFRSEMKSMWLVDPQTWTQNVGIAGDPISGPYTGSITYVGHRSGGYGDEVRNLCGTGGSCVRAGALTSFVWRDSGGVATPDNVGVKWNSTGNNGTLGVGVWGGRPSKAVANFFEWSGFNFQSGVVSNAQRTDILNRTIIWLLDSRDHPAVLVRSPNGGEVITTNTATITWSRTAFGGSVAAQTLYYSDNSGQGWTPIAPGPAPGDTSYVWDVSGLPNGGHYRVRAVVQDDGNPALTGSDASDADFTINRPGGDTQGPLIWPGSVSIVPNPIVTGATVTFRATADDTTRGNSNIVAAELFAGAAPGTAGTGIAMNPADGGFNAPVEDIVWTAAAPWPVGNECFWIHALDAAVNWGPHESRCTSIASTGGVDTTPPLQATLTQGLLVSAGADVRITWQAAPDEGQIGGTVLYRVFRATAIGGPYVQVGGDILGTGSPPAPYTDVGAGDPAPSAMYFYLIRTVDGAGNVADSTSRAAKFSADLAAGVSLVSFPVVAADTSLGGLLQTLTFRGAWTYDGCTGMWLTYSSVRPAGQNSLRTVARFQGLYVDLAAPDRLTVAGLVPTTTRVQLCGGWNLVAFPGFASMTAGQVRTATGASAVLEFDPTAPPGLTRTMAPGDPMRSGRGYWIDVALPVNWDVPGR